MGILSESDESGSIPITVHENFPLSNPLFLGCNAMPRIQYRTVVHSAGKYQKEVQFNDMSATTAGVESVSKYTSAPRKSNTIFILS